jgi:hypothetical protein
MEGTNTMKKGEKAFVVLASKVLLNPMTGNSCHVVSYPEEDERVWIHDLDGGRVVRVKLNSLLNTEEFRKVEEEDWGYSAVMYALGTCADEDLHLEVAKFLKWV